MQITLSSSRYLASFLYFYFLSTLVLAGCSPEKIHADDHLNEQIIIIGEFHGAEQIGDMLVNIAETQADLGQIAIGLEAPACALSTVFSSSKIISLPGDTGAACDMYGIESGRISTALKAGVDKLLEDNQSAKIFAFENYKGRSLIPDFPLHANAWESRAADRILQVRDKGYRVISIAGNLHVRKTTYKFSGPETTPFGALLSDQALIIGVVPLNSGQVYACSPECGIQEIPGSSAASDVGLDCNVGAPYYDCIYAVGQYTPAAPIAKKTSQ